MRNLLTTLMMMVGVVAVAQPTVTVVEGNRPTSREYTNLVCRTVPGATATINGNDVKVYATGCFGSRVNLEQGDNVINVAVTHDGKTTTQAVTVTRKDREERPTTVAPVMRPVLFNVETLPGAFLQYGNGTDRLGGSKMSFIDEGIVLKVVGDYANLYRVQLSEQRFAYIQKEYVKPCDGDVRTVNTGSISYSNTGRTDRVSLSLPCRLPYYSWTQLDPTTINIDIYGAMNNSNWISQHGELGMIDYVDFRQVDSDVFRMVIKLKKKFAWGYSVNYSGNRLVIDVKHTPSLALKNLTIGLDAGHGGFDSPGAIGNTGLKESTINLQLVQLVKQMLEARGARVVMSRNDDSDVSMSDRRKIFREAGVDLMLSIHNNAGGSPFEAMGSSTYYKHIVNRQLAATMLKHLVGCDHKDAGLTGNFNFSLNMPTEYPNALLEVLFMSSLPDEEKLSDPAHCRRIATAVVAGLEDYLNQVKQEK